MNFYKDIKMNAEGINSTINEEQSLDQSNALEETKQIEDASSGSENNFVMFRDEASSGRGTILQKGILTDSFNERMESILDVNKEMDFNNYGVYQEIDELSEDVVSSLIDPTVPKPMKITNIAAYVE